MDPNTFLTNQLIPGNVQVTQTAQGYGTQSIPQLAQTAQGYGTQSIPQLAQTAQGYGTQSIPQFDAFSNIQTTQYQATTIPSQTTNTIITSAPTTQTFPISESPVFPQTTFTTNPPVTDWENLLKNEIPETTTTYNTVITQENHPINLPDQFTQQVDYTINQPFTQEIQTPIVDNNVVTNEYQVTTTQGLPSAFDTGLTLGNVETTTTNLGMQQPPQYETTTTTQQVIQKEFKVVNPNISVVPMPILPPPQQKVIVKVPKIQKVVVPKIQRVVVPKIQRVMVPSKKTVLVNGPNGLPYSTASLPYGTGSVAVPTASVAPVTPVAPPVLPAAVPRPVVPLARPLPYNTLSQPIVPGQMVAPVAPRPVVPVAPRPVVPLSTASVVPTAAAPYALTTYNPLAARGVARANLGMARPTLYNASSFRPAVAAAPVNNMGFAGKYTTRTYNARRL